MSYDKYKLIDEVLPVGTLITLGDKDKYVIIGNNETQSIVVPYFKDFKSVTIELNALSSKVNDDLEDSINRLSYFLFKKYGQEFLDVAGYNWKTLERDDVS